MGLLYQKRSSEISRKKKRVFTKTFKEEAVKLAQRSEKPVAQIARDIGVGEQSLRNWIKQAEIDAGYAGVPFLQSL
ncbi:MAG: transposase [Deltaproteobacteria bacterium]|nr:transposase [Deltaproteobacteria bacterium]